MRNYRKPLVAALAAAGIVTAISAPNTGEYIQDKQNEYVQDRALDRVDTVNMIVCFMSKLRPDAQVNQGEYLALVDEKQCKSDKSNSETTSAGADSSVNYVKALVESTRASNTAAQIMKARLFFNDDGGEQTIFVYAEISEAPSSTNPNGRFQLSFESYPSANLNGTPAGKGQLIADGNTVTFYESESRDQSTSVTQLSLSQSGTNTGSGRVKIAGGNENVDEAFSYNSRYYLRGATGAQSCFDRSRANAEFSTWRYGVYNSSGNRFNLTNPGFPLNYTPTSGNFQGKQVWGYASFYGIFFPDAVLTALKADSSAVLTRPDSNKTYSLTTAAGKLSKLTKVSTTLGSVKGQGIRIFLPSNSGFQQTEVMWDGTNLVKTRTVSFSQNGETSSPASGNVLASDLRNNNQLVLNGYSPSLGGDVQIKVPAAGEFDTDSAIIYRTRSAVTPAQAANLQLSCISQCPSTGSSLNSPQTVYQNVNGQQYNYSPVPTASAVAYTFTNGVMQNNGQAVDASNATGLRDSQFRWGVYSGQMFASTDANSVKCDSNGQANAQGTAYCGRLIADLTDVYQYETGPNTWNQYQSLTETGTSTAVTFDPPKRFNLTLSTSNSTLPSSSPLIGSTIVLEYQGFGQLNGIPGTCVDPATNESVNCGPNTRYVPKFSLIDGTELVDGNTSYFVKYLDREARFRKLAEATCTGDGLSLPVSQQLPSAPTNDVKTLVGSVGDATNQPTTPKVIHGVVQN